MAHDHDSNDSRHPEDEAVITQYSSPEVDIDQIEEMLRNDPSNEGLLDIAAFTYYSNGMLAKALVAYQMLVQIDYNNPVYHYCLANTLYRLKREDEATDEWKITSTIDEGGRYGRRARKRLERVGRHSGA